MGTADDAWVEILTRPECLALLGQVELGRIGASIDALPVILPVHFSLFGETVLFRTVPGTKLDTATLGSVVAFQADSYEPTGDTGWSVLLQGVATAVADRQLRIDSPPIKRWAGNEADHRLIQIPATRISGRRFQGPGGEGATAPTGAPPTPL